MWDLGSAHRHVWWSPEVYELMGGVRSMDTTEARAVEPDLRK